MNSSSNTQLASTPGLFLFLAFVALLAGACGDPAPAGEAAAPAMPAMDEAAVPLVKGGGHETGPYEVVPNWPQPIHDDWTWGRTPAVWAETPNKVFVLQSAELPVLVDPPGVTQRGGVPPRSAVGPPGERFEHLLMIMDAEGALVDSWEQHNELFSHSHRIAVDPRDPARHVWVADNSNHQVFKFTNDGTTLVATIGEVHVRAPTCLTPRPSDLSPEDLARCETHLSSPTDIAFLHNGDVLVTDSGNARIVRFTPDGQYVSEFGGQRGTGSGEIGGNLHGIAVDATERIYVADRGNARIQVFDVDGAVLDVWPDIRFPCFVGISEDQHVWVTDALTNKLLKYDLDGRLLYAWGTFGGEPGQFWGPHHLSTDSEGNLYVTEVWGGRVQKFRPKPGADPDHLVGQLFWQ